MDSEKLQILKEVLGECYQTNDEYLFFCPFCKHHKRKLSINISKNTYKCWVCDNRGRSIYNLIKRFGHYKHKQQWKSFENQVDLTKFDNIFEDGQEADRSPSEQRIELPASYLCLVNKRLPQAAQMALNYLKERGLTKEDILKWKIGYCSTGSYKNRVIIPSFNKNGYCNYFVARSYTNDWMKYKNPPASKDVVFNDLTIDWEEPIVLVEGIFDAVQAKNSIPLLGSTISVNSNLFNKIIDGYEDVGQMSKNVFNERKINAEQMTQDFLLVHKICQIV